MSEELYISKYLLESIIEELAEDYTEEHWQCYSKLETINSEILYYESRRAQSS